MSSLALQKISPASRGGIVLLGALTVLFVLLRDQGLAIGGPLTLAGILMAFRALWLLPAKGPSLRFLPIVIALIITAIFIKALTLRYFLLAFSVALIIEILLEKRAELILAILFTVSPLFGYVSEVFTFPIRLTLSQWAAGSLQRMGRPVRAEGNTLLLDGVPFHVDPACMGLQMLAVSLLAGIFLLVYFQHVFRKNTGALLSCLFLSAVLLLNLVSNFIRILVLVWYRVVPENAAHDLVGLVCLLVYVLIPSWFAARFIVSKWGTPRENPAPVARPYATERFLVGLLVITACLQLSLSTAPPRGAGRPYPGREGYTAETAAPGVQAYRNVASLVYLKDIPHFYSVEHSPQVCWRGSGYELRNVLPATVRGYKIYTGRLTRSDGELFTAWWFSNGLHHTTGPLDWRWRMFKGESPFVLVNVTAGDPASLKDAVGKWLPGEGSPPG